MTISITKYKALLCAMALATAGMLGGAGAYGQGNHGGAPNTVPDSTIGKSADTTFLNKAASGGMAEVKMGQLATQKASSTAVKGFGMRMMAEHSKANDQLKDVAAKQNVTLPARLDAQDQATYNRLAKLSGAQFDREYMKDMVQDHEQDVSEFKREAGSGKNPDVKNFAAQTLPTLEQHLTLARQTENQMGASNRTGYEAKPAR